jgi:hypothetical protein
MLQAVNFNRSRRYTRQNLLSIWRTVNLIVLYNGLMMVWAITYNNRDDFVEYAVTQAFEPYLTIRNFGFRVIADVPNYYLPLFIKAFMLQLGLLVLSILVIRTFVRVVRPDVFSGLKRQKFFTGLAFLCCGLFLVASPYLKAQIIFSDYFLGMVPDIGYMVTMVVLVSIVSCEFTELRLITHSLLPVGHGMPKNNPLGIAGFLLAIFGFFQAIYLDACGSFVVRTSILWIKGVVIGELPWYQFNGYVTGIKDFGFYTCLLALVLGVVSLFRRKITGWQGFVVPVAGIVLSVVSMIFFRFPDQIHGYIPRFILIFLWRGIW